MNATRALGGAALSLSFAVLAAVGCSGTYSEDGTETDESAITPRPTAEPTAAPAPPSRMQPRPPRPPGLPDDYKLRADAPRMQTLEAASGWRRLKVQGNLLDSKTKAKVAADEEIVVVDSPAAVSAAPISANTKKQIASKLAAMPRNKQGGMIIVRKKVEDDLAKVPAPTPTGAKTMASCADSDETYSDTYSKSKPFEYTQGDESGAFSGSIAINGTASGAVTGAVVLHVDRVSIPFVGCETYWGTLVDATLDGKADVVGDAKANGTFQKEWHKSTTVLEPIIYDDWISIAGLPIKITVSLPIDAGIDASAKIQASLDVHSEAHGTFNMTCTSGGCDGSKSTTFDFKQNNTASVGLNARAHVAPWAQGSVKVELYDGAADAKLGVRATLDGDFWGYEGNTCGSPHNNGLNDNVKAATLDANLLVDLRASVSLFGADKDYSWNLLKHHAGFWDLLNGGSTALTPMVWYENYGSTAHGMMRPCYPYTDTVHYKIDWNDRSAPDTVDSAPQTAFTKDHTYGNIRNLPVASPEHTITVTAVNDTQDRSINQTAKITSQPVAVGANAPPGGSSTPSTPPSAPTTGATTPTTGGTSTGAPSSPGTRPPIRAKTTTSDCVKNPSAAGCASTRS